MCRLRKRTQLSLSPEEKEQRALFLKKWSLYRLKQHAADMKMLDRIEYSQQLALDKLREESEELFQAAIQVSSESKISITFLFIFSLFLESIQLMNLVAELRQRQI